jgi:hypothetical protein
MSPAENFYESFDNVLRREQLSILDRTAHYSAPSIEDANIEQFTLDSRRVQMGHRRYKYWFSQHILS